ncbi:hypothetical protein G6F46_006691 [Rhizopus delemar]|uniref:Uncharacterized protein n=2 Tax=Rhizopus TaxID=4842 RepID=A0A9P7CMU6_9FUNG|nr:hypothetical protein G6F55_005683 [Rhizopus delemar]KAG1546534.1 hypothetical protein G6F51_004826 [Rhizopus arrhizus]KAG1495581.1 hypothetical protein G6F54_007069 [Rhizopus delemar]KAG1508953.1 hypothetical protein G6F53_007806 [Rhizopus delemar]KAG1554288.1 hypothetical protein G6F49_008114 [Rhizopus delemar]
MSDTYFFPSTLDPSVPEFFSRYTLSEWTLKGYEDYCLSENLNITHNCIIKQYREGLQKIVANEDIPINIKGKVGELLKNYKGSARRTKSTGTSYKVNIETNNGTVFGDVTINNNVSSTASKKQKIDHLSDGCWNINDQEDVWEAWGQYLDSNISHDFCLEKYHIIECGYSIKCNPRVPEELMQFVNTDNHTITTPFKGCTEYTSVVISAMRTGNMEAIERVVNNSKEAEERALDVLSQEFIKDLFKLCVKTHALKFVPGEYILRFSKEENKVDGCVLFGDVEVFLLETSGKLFHNESGKYGLDHIKSNFGALTMFNDIYKKYYWGSERTAISLKIPFLHARLPTDLTATKDIVDLGNLIWCLKNELENAVDTIRKLKDEHDQYSLHILLSDDINSRVPLSELVNFDIQKPIKGSGYGILLPEEKEEAESSVHYKNS